MKKVICSLLTITELKKIKRSTRKSVSNRCVFPVGVGGNQFVGFIRNDDNMKDTRPFLLNYITLKLFPRRLFPGRLLAK